MARQTTRAEDIAGALADLVAAEPQRLHLPPARELCSRFTASRWTVRKALSILHDRGLVTYRQGSAIAVCGRQRMTKPAPSSAERLYQDLRRQIADGALQAGSQVPKASFLVATWRVSKSTIARVNSRLIDEGLAHRAGKRVIVGATRRPDATAVKSPPVIVVVVDRRLTWRSAFTSRIRPFVAAFSDQAESRGVRLLFAQRQGTLDLGPDLHIEGFDASVNAVRRLGTRYLGTLVLLDREADPELSLWISRLLGLRRPVVWFDRNGRDLEHPIRNRHFSRCYFTESKGVKAAMEYLFTLGHRRIVYPSDLTTPWEQNRYALLQGTASVLSPEMRIIGAPNLADEYWVPPGSMRTDRLLSRLERSRIPALRSILKDIERDRQIAEAAEALAVDVPDWGAAKHRQFLTLSWARFVRGVRIAPESEKLARVVWTALQLAPLLCDPLASCVLAPNDAKAFPLLRFFRAIGEAVPTRYSLMAFDNTSPQREVPITSVDWGFGWLGYAAFHSILGDVPVNRDRNGAVPAQPFVVDQGTAGLPPRAASRTGSAA